MSNVLIISADCHAGGLPAAYKEYMPSEFHEASDAWWLSFVREMMARVGTFFDQEAVEDYAEKAGEGGGRMKALSAPPAELSDDVDVTLTRVSHAVKNLRGGGQKHVKSRSSEPLR